MIPPPPRSTLFPYTALFRAPVVTIVSSDFSARATTSEPSDPRSNSAASASSRCARAGQSSSRDQFDTVLAEIPVSSAVLRSEEHLYELQSRQYLVRRLLLEH